MTPAVLNPVVLEDLTPEVSEVPIELPDFSSAAIIKKAAFAFHLWAVLHTWAASESTQESTPVREPSESTPVNVFTPGLTQVCEVITELAPFYESTPESAQV